MTNLREISCISRHALVTSKVQSAYPACVGNPHPAHDPHRHMNALSRATGHTQIAVSVCLVARGHAMASNDEQIQNYSKFGIYFRKINCNNVDERITCFQN